MSRHVVCSALGVATLTLAVCSSACVQTQDEHRPAAQALADLRVSAEAGDAEAQFILGGMYVTGRGVPQDDAEAVAWYRRAAEQGHARAQYNLGAMYDQGRGVPQDDAEAVAWYRRAAEQGHARAQYNLGGMCREGRGVPQDDVEAHMWLTIAASRSTGAERELIVTARDAGAVRMTPTDLREAERRAQAWHAAHQDMRNRAAPPSDTGREGLIIALGSLSQGEHGSAAKSDREVWSKCRKKTGHPTSVLTRLVLLADTLNLCPICCAQELSRDRDVLGRIRPSFCQLDSAGFRVHGS